MSLTFTIIAFVFLLSTMSVERAQARTVKDPVFEANFKEYAKSFRFMRDILKRDIEQGRLRIGSTRASSLRF